MKHEGPQLDGVVGVDRFAGRDDAETAAVLTLLEDATDYALSLGSGTSLRTAFVGAASDRDVAVFLLALDGPEEAPAWRWVVAGELPPAVLPGDGVPTARAALRRYAEAVAHWVEAVRTDAPMDEAIPLDVPPTPAYADLLEERVRALVIPRLTDAVDAGAQAE